MSIVPTRAQDQIDILINGEKISATQFKGIEEGFVFSFVYPSNWSIEPTKASNIKASFQCDSRIYFVVSIDNIADMINTIKEEKGIDITTAIHTDIGVVKFLFEGSNPSMKYRYCSVVPSEISALSNKKYAYIDAFTDISGNKIKMYGRLVVFKNNLISLCFMGLMNEVQETYYRAIFDQISNNFMMDTTSRPIEDNTK